MLHHHFLKTTNILDTLLSIIQNPALSKHFQRIDFLRQAVHWTFLADARRVFVCQQRIRENAFDIFQQRIRENAFDIFQSSE